VLTLLAVTHILIGLVLVIFVLLQDSKGGAMGVFSGGGSSNSFFGSSGASNFLTIGTTWLAVAFAGTCLALTYMTTNHGNSVMDNYTAPAAATPTAPGAPAVPGTEGAKPAAGTETAPAIPAAPATDTAPADSKQ
jgi:preprotein translocase subunit SecG